MITGVTRQDESYLAKLLLKKSLDKGVNFFDTSDTYGDGRSEKFLSELKKKQKKKFILQLN